MKLNKKSYLCHVPLNFSIVTANFVASNEMFRPSMCEGMRLVLHYDSVWLKKGRNIDSSLSVGIQIVPKKPKLLQLQWNIVHWSLIRLILFVLKAKKMKICIS